MWRLIQALFEAAVKAQISFESSEMKHFSRWAFLESRRAAAAGMAREAESCFSIAKKVTGKSPDNKFRIYDFLVKVIGWQLTGRLFMALDRVLKPQPGSEKSALTWTANS